MTNTTRRVIPIFFAAALWLPPKAMGQAPAMPSMMDDRAMAEMMSGMKSKHQEMAELLAKALEDVKALQSEKDSKKVKSRLADHAAMLERMRGKMAEHEEMMKKMAPGRMMPGMMEHMKTPTAPAGKPPETAPGKPDEADHSKHHPAEEAEERKGPRE